MPHHMRIQVTAAPRVDLYRVHAARFYSSGILSRLLITFYDSHWAMCAKCHDGLDKQRSLAGAPEAVEGEPRRRPDGGAPVVAGVGGRPESSRHVLTTRPAQQLLMFLFLMMSLVVT